MFSYQREDMPSTIATKPDRQVWPVPIGLHQAVDKIRPAGNVPIADEGADERTPDEDLIAAHVLSSMKATGKSVFGHAWPKVRAELTPHVRTMALQGDLGDYTRGNPRTIELTSVPGAKVVLSARVETLRHTASTTLTESFNGGVQSSSSTVSRNQVTTTQTYLQGLGDLVPLSVGVNLAGLLRVVSGFGRDETDSRAVTAAIGSISRQKVHTVTHAGTAIVTAQMSAPGDVSAFAGSAKIDFNVRAPGESTPADRELRKPRAGIIQERGAVGSLPRSERRRQARGDTGPGLPARGLSRDSIVRKNIDTDFRDKVRERLDDLETADVKHILGNSLDSVILHAHLPAMTRVDAADLDDAGAIDTDDWVELVGQGHLHVFGRADIADLKFISLANKGAKAWLLNDVTQPVQRQRGSFKEIGARLLFGPHAQTRDTGVSIRVLTGLGFSRRKRFESMFGQTARIAANAKFSRKYAIFDAPTNITLLVQDGDTRHLIDGIEVVRQVLIPEIETEKVAESTPAVGDGDNDAPPGLPSVGPQNSEADRLDPIT